MEFRFSPEEDAFRREVKRFFEHEGDFPPQWKPFHQDGPNREELVFLRGLAKELGRKGWLSLAWPREYGGQEAPVLDAILYEEITYYGAFLGRDVTGVGMLGPTLLKFGTEEQKRKHLPPIARGEVIWAQGYTEPNAGSDLAAVQLRAEERGGLFILNGQKMFTGFAHIADWLFLLARTDPEVTPKHRGLSFLLAEMNTPGIAVRPLYSLTGAHEVNEVFFEDVRVPKGNLVGEKNRGFYIALALLEFERNMWEIVGNARRALERLIGYVQGQRGVRAELRHHLAEMAVELEVARWLYYRNIWLEARQFPFAAEPPTAKVFASEMARRLYQVGLEVLGLYGQLEEGSPSAPLEGELAYLYFSSLRDTIGAGTSEIQRNIIATRGLGLPRG